MHGLLAQAQADVLGAWAPLAVWSSIWPYLLMLLGFSLIVCVHELGANSATA